MMSVASPPMAKQKPKPKSPRKTRSVDFADGKPIIAAIRGTAVFKEWLERYAKSNRTTVTNMIERALVIAADRDGFESPPDR